MSSPSSHSPFDDLLRELDELPSGSSPSGAPPQDESREIALQKLMDASKLLETIAVSLDPSDPKHPLHGVPLPDHARQRLQAIIQRLVHAQGELNAIESALLGDKPPPIAEVPPERSAAYVAAKTKLDAERAAFDTYKQQWEAVFAADPAQRDAHPEVLAYYTQMETYFTDHEAYLKTL